MSSRCENGVSEIQETVYIFPDMESKQTATHTLNYVRG